MSYYNVVDRSDSKNDGLVFFGDTAVGGESSIINEQLKASVFNYTSTVARTLIDPYYRFISLKSEWERDTAHLSSITEISMHPAYQQIIGMGADILPFIFFDMHSKPNYWFWALQSISGENPVPIL